MLDTSPDKIKAMKRKIQIEDFIFNTNSSVEIWGGVGIAALDWNPIEKNILAIATKKTNRLEIWNLDLGKMIGIMDLKTKVLFLKWSPHNPTQLIALERTENPSSIVKKMLVIDYKTEEVRIIYDVMLHFSSISWHPKKPGHYVYGTIEGTIRICQIDTMA